MASFQLRPTKNLESIRWRDPECTFSPTGVKQSGITSYPDNLNIVMAQFLVQASGHHTFSVKDRTVEIIDEEGVVEMLESFRPKAVVWLCSTHNETPDLERESWGTSTIRLTFRFMA